MKQKLALLSIGSHFEKNIYPVLEKNKNIEFCGIFTRNNELKLKYCKKFNCTGFDNENDFYESGDFNNVYISSPNAIHYEQISRCISKGKNVLVEKPAVTNITEISNIEVQAKIYQTFFMEAFCIGFIINF